jgi:Tfp pilus assembly PilM family ATPase
MSLSRYPWHRGISPIGLDFGSDQLRALQLRTGADAPFAAMVVEFDAAAKPTLAQRAEAAARRLRSGGFVGREIVIGLPPSVARMCVVRVPSLAGPDGREAIAWEAAERTGTAREMLVADGLPTGAPSNSQEGKEEHLLVSVAEAELGAACDKLIEAGFEPIAAEPRFAAVARALSRRARRDSDTADVRAVIHVEQHGSTVMVLRGDRIAFCREISMGGDALDQAVATRLSVPVSSASMLRAGRIALARGRGEAVDAVTEEAVLAATRATLDALAGEVALCLRYFGVTFRGGQPARIVLSGPQGAEPRLGSIIEETCRSTVVLCDDELPAAAATTDFARIGAPKSGDIADWVACFGLACRSRVLAAIEGAA